MTFHVTDRFEAKACDAAVRILEQRVGQSRLSVERHARIGDRLVEATFTLAGRLYAIEHTRIESFEHQIYWDKTFDDFIPELEASLVGALPGEGVYRLLLQANVGVLARPYDRTLDVLAGWIRSEASELVQEVTREQSRPHNISRLHARRQDPPSEIGFKAILEYRPIPKCEGRLFAIRFEPPELEAKRLAVLQKAVEAKFGLLAACRAADAVSILVLEDRDQSSSNHWLVSDALQAAVAERGDAPSEIFLVESYSDEWPVAVLMREGKYWPDDQPAFLRKSDLREWSEWPELSRS